MNIANLVNTVICLRKGDKFKVDFTTGGGKEVDEGEWIIKTKTDKSLVAEKISEKGIWDNYEKGDRIKIGAKHHNPVRYWEDGTFTVYPNQAGTPYYFQKINNIPEALF